MRPVRASTKRPACLTLLALFVTTGALVPVLTASTASATHASDNAVEQDWELLAETFDGVARTKVVSIERGTLPGGTTKFDPQPTATLHVVGRHTGGAGASRWEVQLHAANETLGTISFGASDTGFAVKTATMSWLAANKSLKTLKLEKIDDGLNLAGTFDIRKAYIRIRQEGVIKKTVARVPLAVKQTAITSTTFGDVADVVFYKHTAGNFDPAPTVTLRTTGVEQTQNPIQGSLHVQLVDSSGTPVSGAENVHSQHGSVTSPALSLTSGETYRLQVRVDTAVPPENGEVWSADLVLEQATTDAHGLVRTVGFYPSVTAGKEVATNNQDLDFLLKAPDVRAPEKTGAWQVSAKTITGGAVAAALRDRTSGTTLATTNTTSGSGWLKLDADGVSLPVSGHDLDTRTVIDAGTTGRLSQSLHSLAMHLRDVVIPVITSFSASPLQFSPNADGTKDRTTFSATISDYSPLTWTLRIKNAAGAVVRSFSGTGQTVSQEWDGTDSLLAPVPDAIYIAELTATDELGNSSLPSSRTVTVDTASPSIDPQSLTPGQFENTVFTSQALFASVTDSLSGVDASTPVFDLTNETTGVTTSHSGTFSSPWAKTSPLSLTFGNWYRFSVSVRDEAGNLASLSQRPQSEGGSFLVTSIQVPSTTARIAQTTCSLSAPDAQTDTRLATCPGVALNVDAGTVTLGGTRHPDLSFVKHTVPLTSATIKSTVGGQEVSLPACSPCTGPWSPKTVAQPFEVPVGTALTQTYGTLATTDSLGTLNSTVPASWTEAFLQMDGADAATTQDPGYFGCADPSAQVLGDVTCLQDPLVSRFVVMFQSAVSDAGPVIDEHAAAHGVWVVHRFTSAPKGYSGYIPLSAIEAIRADSRVRAVFRDRDIVISTQPVAAGDAAPPTEIVPTGVDRINAEGKANKGQGIDVAVLDSGIDLGHQEFTGRIFEGKNCESQFTQPTQSFQDLTGHGTHVAGTLAAASNGLGVVGVAPEVRIRPVKVLRFGSQPTLGTFINSLINASVADMMCGVQYVIDHSPEGSTDPNPIRVANLSHSIACAVVACGSGLEVELHAKIQQAVNNGVTFVVSTGNTGDEANLRFPAGYDEVIAATNLVDTDGTPCGLGPLSMTTPTVPPGGNLPDDQFDPDSGYADPETSEGGHLLAAPGQDIFSTWLGNTYRFESGTSMSAPHIAGTAALRIRKFMDENEGVAPAPADVLLALRDPANSEAGADDSRNECEGTQVAHMNSANHTEPLLRADNW